MNGGTVDTGAPVATPSRRRADTAQPGWLSYLGTEGAAKILLLAALMAWLYWAHLYRLYSWWQQPDWSHGFLIPFFSLYIVNTKKKELMGAEHRGSVWGLALILLSLYVYRESIQRQIGYPQPLSMVSMTAGLVLFLCGWRTLWLTLFPIGFLVLAIPPPERLYREITQPLQQGAAAIAQFILNAFPGAEVERHGINLSYYMQGGTTGTFTVAGACSGMRSLMAFVALGLAAAYFTPRPTWHRVLMAVLVVPVALFCNVLRVIITGGFSMYGHGELASGTPHTVLGLAMFGLGFAIYMGILWVLDHLFVESPQADEAEVPGGGVPA